MKKNNFWQNDLVKSLVKPLKTIEVFNLDTMFINEYNREVVIAHKDGQIATICYTPYNQYELFSAIIEHFDTYAELYVETLCDLAGTSAK